MLLDNDEPEKLRYLKQNAGEPQVKCFSWAVAGEHPILFLKRYFLIFES